MELKVNLLKPKQNSLKTKTNIMQLLIMHLYYLSQSITEKPDLQHGTDKFVNI